MDEKDLVQHEIIHEEQQNQTNEDSAATGQAETGVIAPQQLSKEQREERNFANLREKANRAERERDEALRVVREMEARQKQPEPIDEEILLGENDLAEGKHLGKLQKQIKNLSQELKKYKQEATLSSVETKIRTNYPDFDNVVSRQNLESLKNLYPEIAQTIYSAQDEYSKAASAYTLIKKLGIDTQESYEMDKKRVQDNAAKPKPIASLGSATGQPGALAHANAFAGGLTKDLQAQLLKEMMEARKGY